MTGGTDLGTLGDGIDLEAVSTVGPVLRPGEPGEFFVCDHGKPIGDRTTLEALVDVFRRALGST